MRLLVLLEFHFIRCKNGNVYTEVTADYNFWSRYLDVFENITVCARMYDADENFDPSKYLLASREKVDFIGLPDFKGVGGILKNYSKIRKIIKRTVKKNDCIIFRAPSPISLIAYPIIKRSKKPFAVELMMNPYTAYSKEALNHYAQPIIQHFITKQTKDICLTANGVSYVTERVLQNLYPCKAILQNEQDNRYFTASYSTITLHEEDFYYKDWGQKTNEDPIVLIHSGKMEDYRKGQTTFIRMLEKIVNHGYNVKAIMIGDGSKSKEFKDLAVKLNVIDRIEFTGWLAGFDLVKEQLRRADIFVFPTIGEGLPRSVIEAMANGLVCVSSPVDGVIELLESDVLAKYDDVDGFVKIVEELIENKERMMVISEENTNKARKYNEKNIAARRYEFYMKLKALVTKPNNSL